MSSSRAYFIFVMALMAVHTIDGEQAINSGIEKCSVKGCCEEDCCSKGTFWDTETSYCIVGRNSFGFSGTHSARYHFGCVARVCCEEWCCGDGTSYDAKLECCVVTGSTSQPSLVPTYLPFESPTSQPSVDTDSCVPTTGPCVSTYSELQTVASSAPAHGVIAICGNGIPIVTESAIVFNKPKIKLCCSGTNKCILKSAGLDRNLVILDKGPSCTLQDIAFVNGKTSNDGGNVKIMAGGNQRIVGCNFRGGQAGLWGGNLYLENAQSVTIEKSTFVNGTASMANFYGGGGGLAVRGPVTEVSLDACTFRGNRVVDGEYGEVSGSGGGVAFIGPFGEPTFQHGTISNCSFDDNEATDGAGLYVYAWETFSRLAVVDTNFNRNIAGNRGGAASITHRYGLDLTLSGNSGSENVGIELGFETCHDISLEFVTNPGEEIDFLTPAPPCLNASDDYP